MTRSSTSCLFCGMVTVFALSANGASAANVNVHTTVPTIKIVPTVKVSKLPQTTKTLGPRNGFSTRSGVETYDSGSGNGPHGMTSGNHQR